MYTSVVTRIGTGTTTDVHIMYFEHVTWGGSRTFSRSHSPECHLTRTPFSRMDVCPNTLYPDNICPNTLLEGTFTRKKKPKIFINHFSRMHIRETGISIYHGKLLRWRAAVRESNGSHYNKEWQSWRIKKLFVDGYTYARSRARKDVFAGIARRPDERGTYSQSDDPGLGENIVLFKGPADSAHEHPPNREEVTAVQLAAKLKRKATEHHLAQPTAQIMCNELAGGRAQSAVRMWGVVISILYP